MEPITKQFSAPAVSIILNGLVKYDYCDSFSVPMLSNEGVDSITTKIFRIPDWVNILMKIRNTIVGVFGLKTGNKKNLNEAAFYPVGSRAVYFTVIDRNDNEIVMSENDKHLVFRTSVMINKTGNNSLVHLTTVVRYNNFWGRFYFFFVKPFHQLIMRAILKRLNNNLPADKQ
jgi:hypothetical protein